jgi:hypothetical protein
VRRESRAVPLLLDLELQAAVVVLQPLPVAVLGVAGADVELVVRVDGEEVLAVDEVLLHHELHEG